MPNKSRVKFRDYFAGREQNEQPCMRNTVDLKM